MMWNGGIVEIINLLKISMIKQWLDKYIPDLTNIGYDENSKSMLTYAKCLST